MLRHEAAQPLGQVAAVLRVDRVRPREVSWPKAKSPPRAEARLGASGNSPGFPAPNHCAPPPLTFLEEKKMKVFLETVGLQEFRPDSRLCIADQLSSNVLESLPVFIDPTSVSGNRVTFCFMCQLNFHDLLGYFSSLLKGFLRKQKNYF